MEFMGLARPVHYENADLTISNIGFAEADLVIKILEGLKHGERKPSSPVEHVHVAVAADEIAKAVGPKVTPKNVEPAPELKAEPAPAPKPRPAPEPKPEPAPKKRRGRKKKEAPPPEPDPNQTDLEEYIDELDPEPEPDEVDDEIQEEDDEPEDDEDDDVEVDVPVIKITNELKACKTVRVIVEMLMDQGLDGAQTRAWLLENTSEIPTLKRLGHRLPERLDRLANLINVPDLAAPE